METLLKQLFQEAYRLNQTGRYAVFFNYSGHVNNIEVYVYEGKWTPETKTTKLNVNIYLDFEWSNERINDLINELKILCNE